MPVSNERIRGFLIDTAENLRSLNSSPWRNKLDVTSDLALYNLIQKVLAEMDEGKDPIELIKIENNADRRYFREHSKLVLADKASDSELRPMPGANLALMLAIFLMHEG